MIDDNRVIDNSPNDDSKTIEAKLLDIYKHMIIETGFVRRFHEAACKAREKKEILVIGAYTRYGKSWSIMDLVNSSGGFKTYDGKTYLPILAIQAPDSANPNQLVRDICHTFGDFKLPTIDQMKIWLVDNIPIYGVEQIIFDDAHELNQNHFRFIKWLNDKLILEKKYHISIVFSSIMGPNGIDMWRKLTQYNTETWCQQFYERFSTPCKIYGLSPDEVTQVLYDYEGIYSHLLPDINLIPYSSCIFAWLTNPRINIYGTGYVCMSHISKLLYEAARIACIEYKYKNIPIDLLEHVFKTQLLNKDSIYQTDPAMAYKPKKIKTSTEKNCLA